MSPKRYCLTLGAAAATIAAAVAAFNYAVDPYLLFDVRRVHGFNALKPSVDTRERMMKAYQAERVDARTIMLGSSRSDLGIDPASSSWPASAKPVYNLSLVGSDTATGIKYLRHHIAARSGSAPRTVVVGLDFEAFLYRPGTRTATRGAAAAPGEVDQRLMVDRNGNPNEQRRMRVLTDQALGLLSLDAIYDSMRTIAGNRSHRVVDLRPDGRMSDEAMRQTAEVDGFALLFDQKNIETVKRYAAPRYVLSDANQLPIRDLRAVSELLALAREHRMAVVLAVQPAHVSRLELLDRLGYWSDYERWKRELTALVARAGRDQEVALWDFGGYEAEAQERVPQQGTRARMRWFWDPVHYSTALGEKMVARMFDPQSSSQYGVRLTPANIEEHLARVRVDRNAFRAAMPDETARLARLACGDAPCPDFTEPLTASR